MPPTVPSPEVSSSPDSQTPGALQAAQEAQAAFLSAQSPLSTEAEPPPTQAPTLTEVAPIAVAVPVSAERPAGAGFLGALESTPNTPIPATTAASEQQFAQSPDNHLAAEPYIPEAPAQAPVSPAFSPATETVTPETTAAEVPTTQANGVNVLKAGARLVIPPQVGDAKVEAMMREDGIMIAGASDLRGTGEKLKNLPEQMTIDETTQLIGELSLAQRYLENQVLNATAASTQAA